MTEVIVGTTAEAVERAEDSAATPTAATTTARGGATKTWLYGQEYWRWRAFGLSR